MLRDSSAPESIYGFASEQADVQPSEPIFVLTSSQLQELLGTIQSLNDEVKEVKDLSFANLKTKVSALESTQEQDVNRMAVDIALDRQRLSKLEQREPQPLQKDRAEILRALIVANGGKMLAKESRKMMHLSKDRFSKLLAVSDFIETKPYHLDRRQDVIILKSELVARN